MITINLLASAMLLPRRGNISLTSCKQPRRGAQHGEQKPSTPKSEVPRPENNTPSQQKIIDRIIKKGGKIFY